MLKMIKSLVSTVWLKGILLGFPAIKHIRLSVTFDTFDVLTSLLMYLKKDDA